MEHLTGWPRLVSVIVPVFNGAPTLGEQLEALAAQTYAGAWELIVSDNGSSDGSRDLARSWAPRFPSLAVVDASERPGANHARNEGARVAGGDLLAFCDADDVATPGWLEALVREASSCALVGGRLDEEALNAPLLRQWRDWGPGSQSEDGLPMTLRFLPFVLSANFAIRASVFRDLGGWDEGYRHGGDDVDLCWRAQLAGHRLCLAPGAVMKYRFRPDLRGLAHQSYDYGLCDPQLYRRFRARGLERSSVKKALKGWAWLGLHVPDLWRSPGHRGVWVRNASHRWGRLRGSIRHRVVFL